MTLLERVADGFENGTYGWCQGTSVQFTPHQEPRYSYCLDGALQVELDHEYGSQRGTMARTHHYREVIEALDETCYHVDPKLFHGDFGKSFINFNDHETTTKQDVIDVLRKTAANNPEIA